MGRYLCERYWWHHHCALRARGAYSQVTVLSNFWKEYDNTVFKLPCERRAAWLQEHRVEVIQRLNAGYFKLWFPTKDGWVVEDLGDMTYEETMLHLVCLVYMYCRQRHHA
jgi:enoyl reductase-like protein